jgi:TonB family protein
MIAVPILGRSSPLRTLPGRWLVLVAALGMGAPRLAIAAAPAPERAAPKLTKAPELVTFVQAQYPASEQAEGRSATVTLRIHIDAEGGVEKVEVVESAGEAFDAAAQAAALGFRFTPAELDDKPAAISILYDYRFTIAEPEPAPTTAAFEGVIRDRTTGAPLAGVTVTVRSEGEAEPRSVITAADGRFVFDALPPGSLAIELTGERLTATATTETIEPGQRLEVAYDVSPPPAPTPDEPDGDDLEIVVVAPLLRREVVATSVTAEEARRVPGTSGDVVRVVESLPGVARSAAGAGQLVVWGAAPQSTRVYVDGVPISRLYHEGGFRSVIHPSLVGSIDLVPGGYGAAFGRGLGGLVTVQARTPERERVGGRVHADVLDASAMLTGPLGKRKRLHVAAAARGSYLEPWARPLLDRDASGLVPIPRYGDGQLRAQWRPNARDRLEAVALVSVDRFRRGVPSPDPALAVADTRQLDFGRAYARWTRDSGDGTMLTVPGLRLDPYARAVSRRNPPAAGAPAVGLYHHDFAAEPRLAVVGRPHERLALRTAVGLYRQRPASEDLSAAFGTPALPAARALHTVLGANVEILRSLALEATGFFTRSHDLAVRNSADAPLPSRALEPVGRGRAYGLQVLLRQSLARGLSGWVAYTLMRSERKDRPEAGFRRFDFDQTHVLTAVLAQRLPWGLEASGRFRYATGLPRTPVEGAYFDARRNRYQPVFGAHNSIRIPPFLQLDLRVAKIFAIQRTTLEIYLEVLNAWNRANAEEIVYSPDFRDAGYIRGFPVLPNLGVQWDF